MRIKAKVVGAESREYGNGNGFGTEMFPVPYSPALFTDFSCSDSHLFQIFYSTFPIYSTILFLQGGAQRSSPVCGFPAARSGSWQAPTTAPRDK